MNTNTLHDTTDADLTAYPPAQAWLGKFLGRTRSLRIFSLLKQSQKSSALHLRCRGTASLADPLTDIINLRDQFFA
ncbi:MAG: hypothetical protein ACRCV9_07840 [Burkholderiaceae bacterium]